jgi:UDP-glucose:(heptosyl)LPS alpha-1,3-glucosyltransferase
VGTTVGFLIDRWDPGRGGAERALTALAAHLEARGHRVLAFALEGDGAAPGELRLVKAGGITRSARERALASALPEAARAAECDVTVGVRHLGEVDFYWPHGGSHAAALAARRRARGLDPEASPRGRHKTFVELERALLEGGGARRVVCVSEATRAELEERYPACGERAVVIENGVDLVRFHPGLRAAAEQGLACELEVRGDAPLLAFVAREPELKGLEPLLRALAGLTDLPWHLIVAGPRRGAKWERMARRLGLGGERVTVRTHVPAEVLLAGADLCVLPTWRDPCPLVVLESLACGTPVVTTRGAGNAHLVSAAGGSVVEAPDDPALGAELRAWMARIRSGAVERDAVRACVAERGAREWLAALEREVIALAP